MWVVVCRFISLGGFRPPAYDPFKFSRLRSNPVTTDVNDRLERLLMMYVRLMFANVPEDDRRKPTAGAVATTDGTCCSHWRVALCVPCHGSVC